MLLFQPRSSAFPEASAGQFVGQDLNPPTFLGLTPPWAQSPATRAPWGAGTRLGVG